MTQTCGTYIIQGILSLIQPLPRKRGNRPILPGEVQHHHYGIGPNQGGINGDQQGPHRGEIIVFST